MNTNNVVDKLHGLTVSGLFDLQMHLLDHTTEAHVGTIHVKANLLVDEFRFREKAKVFTPVFKFTKESGREVNLEISNPQGKNIGVIPLRVTDVGNQQVLTLRNKRQPKPVVDFHLNLGLFKGDLLLAMSEHVSKLTEDNQIVLKAFLERFETNAREYRFDLDRTEESLTIVVFRCDKRHSALTLFY